MSDRTWNCITALVVGLIFVLLWAALPPNERGYHRSNGEQAAGDETAPAVAGSFDEPNEVKDLEQPCAENEENRKSDLCAQWKAADAASDSAYWTRLSTIFGGVGVLIGFFTLAAAGAAAWFAKRAADETRRAAAAAEAAIATARGMGQRQLRAYVQVRKAFLENFASGKSPVAVLELENCGQTPAYDFRQLSGIHIDDFPFREPLYLPEEKYVLPPSSMGAGHGATVYVPCNGILTEGHIAKIRAGKAAVCLYGRATYRDIFGATQWLEYRLLHGGSVGAPDNFAMGPAEEGNASS